MAQWSIFWVTHVSQLSVCPPPQHYAHNWEYTVYLTTWLHHYNSSKQYLKISNTYAVEACSLEDIIDTIPNKHTINPSNSRRFPSPTFKTNKDSHNTSKLFLVILVWIGYDWQIVSCKISMKRILLKVANKILRLHMRHRHCKAW